MQSNAQFILLNDNESLIKRLKSQTVESVSFSWLPSAGTIPGATEQDAGDQMGRPVGSDPEQVQHRAHVRGLHDQPAQAAGCGEQRQNQVGWRVEEHARTGGGFQTQVRNQLPPSEHDKYSNTITY